VRRNIKIVSPFISIRKSNVSNNHNMFQFIRGKNILYQQNVLAIKIVIICMKIVFIVQL